MRQPLEMMQKRIDGLPRLDTRDILHTIFIMCVAVSPQHSAVLVCSRKMLTVANLFDTFILVRRRITRNASTSDIILLHLRCSSYQPVATSTSPSLLFDKIFLCDVVCILFSHVSILWCVFVCYLGACVYVCIHMEVYHIFLYI